MSNNVKSNVVIKKSNTETLRTKLRATYQEKKSVQANDWTFNPDNFKSGDSYNAQIHHVIPAESIEGFNNILVSIEKLSGGKLAYDINNVDNLAVLPTTNNAALAGQQKGQFAALHNRGSGIHKEYSDLVYNKLEIIRTSYKDDIASGLSREDIAQRTFDRIKGLESGLRDMLTGNKAEDIKLHLHHTDKILIDKFNGGSGNNGPPIDPNQKLSEAQKTVLREHYKTTDISNVSSNKEAFFGKWDPNIVEIVSADGVKTAKFSSDITKALTLNMDKTSGSIGAASQLISLVSVSTIVTKYLSKNGVPTTKDVANFIKNSNLNISAETLLTTASSAAMEAAVGAAAKMLGGPLAVGFYAYEIYENFSALRGALELAAKASPESRVIQGTIDAIDSAEQSLQKLFGSDLGKQSGEQLTAAQRTELIAQIQKPLDKAGIKLDTNSTDTMDDIANSIATKLVGKNCFAVGTLIDMADGSKKAIQDICIGDEVLAFNGFAQPVPRKVVNLFRNTTKEWLELNFTDSEETMLVTPGHSFLTPQGEFVAIGELLATGNGEAQVVLADNSIVTVTAKHITYSWKTAEKYEKAFDQSRAWQTYNFEVEELHTYIATGVRVHNLSKVVSFSEDYTNSTLVEVLESLGVMDELGTDMIVHKVDGKVAFIAFQESAKVTLSDGSHSLLSDIVNQVHEGGRVIANAIGDTVQDFSQYLKSVAPHVLIDLIEGAELETVAETYAKTMLAHMSVDTVSKMFHLEAKYLATGNDGIPYYDKPGFFDSDVGAAAKGAIVQFAVTAALNGKDMNSSHYAELAKNVSIKAAVSHVVQDMMVSSGSDWAVNQSIVAYTDGGQVTNFTPTPVGAAAISAAVTFVSSLLDRGFENFEQTLIDTAITSATTYVGLTIGVAIAGPVFGPIIGPVIGHVFGKYVIDLFGFGGTPPAPEYILTLPSVTRAKNESITQVGSDGYGVIAREGFNDALEGNVGHDNLIGTGGNNYLSGRQGDDYLTGYAGDDHLFGESGNDHLIGGSGNDILYGGAQSDTLYGGAGNDKLHGGVARQEGYALFPLIEGPEAFYNRGNFHPAIQVVSIPKGTSGPIPSGFYVTLPVFGNQFLYEAFASRYDFREIGAKSTYEYILTRIGAGYLIEDRSGQPIDVIHLEDMEQYNLPYVKWVASGNDKIYGGEGDDKIFGEDGSDILHGGNGNDSIYGDSRFEDGDIKEITGFGAGNDSLFGGDGNDWLNGGWGEDILDGGLGRDTLEGGSGNDVLDGGLGNDILKGGWGNDTLHAYAGADHLEGGPGNDVYKVSSMASGTVISDSGGDDTILITDYVVKDLMFTKSGQGDRDLVIKIRGTGETLVVIEKAFNSFNKFSPSRSVFEKIQFADGSSRFLDDVPLARNQDLFPPIFHVLARDPFVLLSFPDVRDGEIKTYYDQLYGGGYSHVVYSDVPNYAFPPGEYLLFSSKELVDPKAISNGGELLVFTPSYYSEYFGHGEFYSVLSSSSNKSVDFDLNFLRDFPNTLYRKFSESNLFESNEPKGNALIPVNFDTSDNIFNAEVDGHILNNEYQVLIGQSWEAKRDTVKNGTSGNDYLYMNIWGETISAANGHDYVFANKGDDTVHGEQGNDYIDAGEGADLVYGGDGMDKLLGGKGNDILFGGEQNDLLIGGFGSDNLTGGPGADIFVYDSLVDSENFSRDLISDFNHLEDKIDLSLLNIDYANLIITSSTTHSSIKIEGTEFELDVLGHTHLLEEEQFIF